MQRTLTGETLAVEPTTQSRRTWLKLRKVASAVVWALAIAASFGVGVKRSHDARQHHTCPAGR